MKELRIPGNPDKRQVGRLSVNQDTALIVKRIAMAEGRSRKLDDVINDMVTAYIASKHPDWTFEDT